MYIYLGYDILSVLKWESSLNVKMSFCPFTGQSSSILALETLSTVLDKFQVRFMTQINLFIFFINSSNLKNTGKKDFSTEKWKKTQFNLISF